MLRARLSHVGLGAEDPGELAAFYVRALGLRMTEELSDGRIRLACGAGLHALELAPTEGFGHLGLELVNPSAMGRLADRLREQGLSAEVESVVGEHPEVLLLRDADGNRIEVHARSDTGDAQVAADPGCPIRIDHVTLGSPSLGSQLAYFEDILGFRVSDRMGEVFIWLRCNREHHTVALVKAEAPGLDHLAFDVGSWEALKRWCDHLASLDVPLRWGPGRHGPGNNLFVMFEDPAGYRIELSCEMERYWDDLAEYSPRLWRPEAKTINLWGPAPEWRRGITA